MSSGLDDLTSIMSKALEAPSRDVTCLRIHKILFVHIPFLLQPTFMHSLLKHPLYNKYGSFNFVLSRPGPRFSCSAPHLSSSLWTKLVCAGRSKLTWVSKCWIFLLIGISMLRSPTLHLSFQLKILPTSSSRSQHFFRWHSVSYGLASGPCTSSYLADTWSDIKIGEEWEATGKNVGSRAKDVDQL